MKITRIASEHYRIPSEPVGRLPLNGPAAAATTASNTSPKGIDLLVVHVETETGLSGLGFCYLRGPGIEAVRSLLSGECSALALGEESHDIERLFAKAEARFRPVGFSGCAARAYSAIDIALWDLKAKSHGIPLYKLGQARSGAPILNSDIGVLARPAAEVVRMAKAAQKQGAMGFRVEIGSGDVRADADRVREISEGLGEEASITVAADGRYDLATAEALARFFEDMGIAAFEDPIPASDELGLARLASRTELPLAMGSSFDSMEPFSRMMRAGVVRAIRPDIGRLGGITPVMKLAAAAEMFHIAVSPFRMTEVGAHLACGLARVSHVDSVGWFTRVFSGGPTIVEGKLVPGDGPGLGLEVNEEAAALRAG